uniref:Uncharacterized protein n=1 Tax=Panagrolaimus sp. JU765 TaxID=591449 RepID=A0AC34QAA8_9BILA
MVAKNHIYYDYCAGYLPTFYRASVDIWMGSGDPSTSSECNTVYDSCDPAAVGSSIMNFKMNSTATAPNRHDFETEIWRLNNAISKVYKDIEKYWSEERRIESATLKTEEQVLKKEFMNAKELTKTLENTVKEAQVLFTNKQKELRDLEDSDMTYKDPELAKRMLNQLETRYHKQKFSNAREEQLIVKEIERAKRNLTKLTRYLPIAEECKRLETEWRQTRTKFQNQKRNLWEIRERWQKVRQNLKKLREPVIRLKYHLTELKAQKKVLITKYNDERSIYNQWMKNHKSQGLSSFPVAMINDGQDDFEPFLEKKRVCQRLISYLNQLHSSVDNDLPKDLLAEVTEAAQQICANHPRPRISIESDDSADDFPPSFAQLNIKKADDDEIETTSTKSKKRLNAKRSLKKLTMPITHDIDYYRLFSDIDVLPPKTYADKLTMPITHDIDYYRLFSDIDVLPPKTYADVEETLVKVKQILEFYEEQTKLATNEEDREFCLSPIPSIISMNGSDIYDSPLLSPHSTSSTSLFHGESTDESPEVISRASSSQKFAYVNVPRQSL